MVLNYVTLPKRRVNRNGWGCLVFVGGLLFLGWLFETESGRQVLYVLLVLGAIVLIALIYFNSATSSSDSETAKPPQESFSFYSRSSDNHGRVSRYRVRSDGYQSKSLPVQGGSYEKAQSSVSITPDDFQVGDGLSYERHVATVMKRKGFAVSLTPKGPDFGADMIASQHLNGVKTTIVVQVKNYSKNVGIRAIQEVYAAKGKYVADEAWVVARLGFTRQAKQLAKSLGVKLWTITYTKQVRKKATTTRPYDPGASTYSYSYARAQAPRTDSTARPPNSSTEHAPIRTARETSAFTSRSTGQRTQANASKVTAKRCWKCGNDALSGPSSDGLVRCPVCGARTLAF